MTFDKLHKPILPAPAIMDSGEWEVKHSPGGWDLNKGWKDGEPRTMRVDGSRNPLAEWSRRQPMLHAKYSKDLDAPSKEVELLFQAFEQSRVAGIGARRHRLDFEEWMEQDEVRKYLSTLLTMGAASGASGDPISLVASVVAAWPFLQHDSSLREKTKQHLAGFLEEEFPMDNVRIAERSLEDARFCFENAKETEECLNVARKLYRLMEEAADKEQEQEERYSIAELERSGRKERMKSPNVSSKGGSPPAGYEEDPWGEMKIKEPPRPVHHGSKFRGVSRQRSEMGAVMKHPHHYCTDKAIFENTSRRARGVTVLVDASGSTDFSKAELSQVLDEAKGATVAMYRGKRDAGNLTILAKDETRVNDIPPGGNRNIIDGPALQWLASKPGERIWLSDGNVNGTKGHSYPMHKRQCERIVEENDIYHVLNLDECIKLLRGFADAASDENATF